MTQAGGTVKVKGHSGEGEKPFDRMNNIVANLLLNLTRLVYEDNSHVKMNLIAICQLCLHHT